MKRVAIAVFVAILSLVFCISSTFYVSSTAEKAEKYVNDLQLSVKNSQYKAALNQINMFEDFWKSNQYFLAMILHHQTLEEIAETIAVAKANLEYPDENYTGFWSEIATIKEKIDNLKNCEIPSPENIL